MCPYVPGPQDLVEGPEGGLAQRQDVFPGGGAAEQVLQVGEAQVRLGLRRLLDPHLPPRLRLGLNHRETLVTAPPGGWWQLVHQGVSEQTILYIETSEGILADC